MNLVYTIINLIVLFLLLRHFLIKPVSDIMEKRRQMIADGLQSAQDAQSDAQKMKQEYEDALKGAKLLTKMFVSGGVSFLTDAISQGIDILFKGGTYDSKQGLISFGIGFIMPATSVAI